ISSGYPTKKSIFHVKNNSTCTLAWGEVEAFDDVEILDNYVVTVERKADRFPNNYGQYMRVLNKTSFSLYDNLFDFYYDWDQRTTTAPVQLQAVGDNRFVSVYPYDTAYYFNAYSVSSGNISLHKYYTVPTGIQPTIGDVAYNSYDKTLAILLNIDTMGTAMFYNCTSYPTITLTTSKYPKIGSANPPYETRLLSLTNYSSSGFRQQDSFLEHARFQLWSGTAILCVIGGG
ncbi:MAG: hypothetical protein K5867_01150, partial [Bacteroidales bacterium]|nr:hypothetical protein [Bacteroidales bacterium]